ncbi:MAG: hypothetical protein Q9174_005917 [Haloplaca sp. 1 TL-2023]
MIHQSSLIVLSSLLATSIAAPSILSRNADQSDGKCTNGEKPPCADSPLCFYDYGPFVGDFKCVGGTPNWEYCDAAIDIVCTTLAVDIPASDSEGYQSAIGTGVQDGIGADCFAKAANGEGATANLPYDICVQQFARIKGCANNRQWETYDENCVGGKQNLGINGIEDGARVDKTMPAFLLGTTGAFFSPNDDPQPGRAPLVKGNGNPEERPNESSKTVERVKATASKNTPAGKSGGSGGGGRAAISPGRGTILGAG